MRIVFAGTAPIAGETLRALTHDVVAVVTKPDSRQGRHRRPMPSAIAAIAAEMSLPILKPERLKESEFLAAIQTYAPDILVCFAYGKIFPQEFLRLFPKGGLNIHPSLLPRHRGASPLQAAILAGDTETGISIQQIAARMDAGPLFAQELIPLRGTEDTPALGAEVSRRSAQLMRQVLERLEQRPEVPIAQDEEAATYCAPITREAGKIDWQSEAARLERMARAYTPWPGIFTTLNGLLLKLLAVVKSDRHPPADVPAGTAYGTDEKDGILVSTGNGVLGVHEIQAAHRTCQNWKPFLNGHPDFIGSRLGT